MASKSVLVKTNERPNNRLECPICKERFWLRCKYDDHVATHELSRVSCNICSKGFYDQILLDEHYLTHTNVIKTYNCKECERKFLQKFQLEQHMQFHKPVDLKPFVINKKKSVRFNKVTHVKNIIDDTSDSEEFHTSDSDDEEECNISDFEDYSPANKIVQTRSGRVVKRKKLFDDEETEIKHKSPKTEQAYTGRSIITEYKHQKNESSKISNMDAVQKSPKPKQVYAKKSTVTEYNSQMKQSSKTLAIDVVQKVIGKKLSEYNSQMKQSSKTSAIDVVKNNIEKKLSVVVEKMPHHMYEKYLKKGNVATENQAHFGSTQESPKVITSSIAKKPNNLATSVSNNSVNGKKFNSCKGKPKQLVFENVQELPKVMSPNLAKTPRNSTTGDSITDKRSEPSKCTNKNIVNNTQSCSKTVGKFSSGNSKVPGDSVKPLCKGTNNLNKSILSTLSQASAYKSPTCKEYVYVGSNPDFRKIKQAIEEASTMPNHETSFCNNNSLKQFERMAQSKRVLNSPNSNTSKSNMLLSSNASPTSSDAKSDKLAPKDPVSSINSLNSNNSQNVNQLNESIPNEEGILEKKVVRGITVVKVTEEYMKKIQSNPLNQSRVQSIQNNHSPSQQMTENVGSSHLTSDLNKSSNAAASTSVEANTINNVTKTCQGSPIVNSCSKSLNHSKVSTPNKQLTEIAFTNASSAISNESLTLSAEKHFASNLNKSTTTPAKKPETIREIQKSNVIANTSVEIDIKTCQRSSMETPIVGFPSMLEHAKVSGKHLTSNLNESVTAPGESLESQKSNAVASTSIETNDNITETCQRNSIVTPIVYPSSSSLEPSKVLPMQYFQLPNNQVTWTASPNASPAVTNSNSQTFLAGKQETVNESQVSITSVKPYKVNNTKQAYQSNLIQSQVVYPIYLLHTSTPTIQGPNVSLLQTGVPTVQSPNVSLVHTEIPTVQSPSVSLLQTGVPTVQSPNVSLVHTEIPTVQSPSVSLVHTEIPTVQSPAVSLVHTEIPTIQSPDTSLVHSEIAAVESPISVVFTTIQTIQSPTASVVHSKIQTQQTPKLPIKKNETSGNALHVYKNSTLSKRKKITKKSVLEEPYCFTDTSFEFNKNNLKTYQKVAVENTQILPQVNLNKLQTENIAENSVAESEQERKNQLNASIKSDNGNCEDNVMEDAVSCNSTLPKRIRMTRKCLFEEPYAFTDNSFEFNKNNLKIYQKVENTQILSPNNLNKLQTENIAENSIAESEQEHKNELNDSIKSVNDNCKDDFTEDAVSSNKNDNLKLYPINLIEEIQVSYNEKDENKQTFTQTTLNIPQIENVTIEVFDCSQTKQVKSRSRKNHSSDDKLHKDKYRNKNENKLEISPQINRNVAITDENKEITKQSHEIIPVITNSFTINDDFFEKFEQNLVEETIVTLDENIQVTQQSNMNDLLAVKPTDDSRTKSVGTEIKKRLRSHVNKCESNQTETTITIPDKNKQTSLKRSHASSSKTVKKQKVVQKRTKRTEINEKKSKDVKNRTDLLSNVSLNRNNESKETSPKINPDNKSPKNLHEKLLQRYQAKLEEKERKKKEKYELKKKIKYVQHFLSSPSRDSNEENFSKGLLPSSNISVNDIVKISEKFAAETQKQTCVSQVIGTILTMPNNSKDSTDSSFGDFGNDSQKKNESENSKHVKETRAIAKARSITLKFNKDLNENESLQLLDELDELIDTYNIGDKCPFLDKTIRFCCLFVDSYKVRQKAISLRNKLKNMKSS